MFSRTENLMTRGIMEGRDWIRNKDGKREIRIGTIVNCNDEITRSHQMLNETSDEMICFLKKIGIIKFSMRTINTDYEFSNCLTLDEDIYNTLKNKISNAS